MTVFFKKRREAEEALRGRLDALITALEAKGSPNGGASLDRVSEDLLALKRQVTELDAELDWFGAELKKLRGKITGGDRRPSDSEKTTTAATASAAGQPAPKWSPQWFAEQRAALGLPSR